MLWAVVLLTVMIMLGTLMAIVKENAWFLLFPVAGITIVGAAIGSKIGDDE